VRLAAAVAVAFAVLAPAAEARLVVRSVGDPPAALRPGDALTAREVVVNRGRRKARRTAVTYYLSAGATRIRLGSRRLAALPPHRRSAGRKRLTVPGSAAPGAYRLRACVRGRCRGSRGITRVAAVPAPPVAALSQQPAPPPPPVTVTVTAPAPGETTDVMALAGTADGTGDVVVRISAGAGVVQALTAARSGGRWSATPSPRLEPGTYTVQATQQSAASAPTTFTVPVSLLAAGDIAGCDTSGDEATALLLAARSGTVAALGDVVYPDATAQAFSDCYQPTWGAERPRTRPTAGNHEYTLPGATPYYGYFGAAAGDPSRGYYSYGLGTWHVVVLNSNCAAVPCAGGSAQERWLQADLAANPARCTLAYWHHPLFTSDGATGRTTAMRRLWDDLQAAGADVVLTAHSHTYERFAPQRGDGTADGAQGMREFVVGTGGRSHASFTTTAANSEVRDAASFGVLDLWLADGSYRWRFLSVPGAALADAGEGTCR
jgi:hypothetical protein